jgi:hypothetical protein
MSILGETELAVIEAECKRVAATTQPDHGVSVFVTLGELESMLSEIRSARQSAVTLSEEEVAHLKFARRCVAYDAPHPLSCHREAIALLDRLLVGGGR